MKQISRFKYFVLLADMRTGSNLFEVKLNSFKSFICHGELFNPYFVGYPKKKSALGLDLYERDENPVKAIKKLIKISKSELPGFRLFSNHDPRVIEHCLMDPDCAKIVLTRNPLDTFISLLIAKKTDQWKMGDVHKRVYAKVDFQMPEFQSFLDSRLSFKKIIDETIQKTGQSVFNLDFENLHSVETFNGLSKFLGFEESILQFKETIGRQNPEPLSKKVSNYKEMQNELASLSIFENNLEQYVDRSGTAKAKAILLGQNAPVLYAPVSPNYPIPEVVSWMRTLEPEPKLVSSGKSGGEIRFWLNEFSKKVVFSALEHPAERAYRAFITKVILKQPSNENWSRNYLGKHYGIKLPQKALNKDMSEVELEDLGYTKDIHQLNFLNFLKFLKVNLNGQTKVNILDDWNYQFVAIEQYQSWLLPSIIITPHRRDEFFNIIEKQIGISGSSIPKASPAPLFALTLEDIYSAQVERLTRSAYNLDYRRFWIEDWSP